MQGEVLDQGSQLILVHGIRGQDNLEAMWEQVTFIKYLAYPRDRDIYKDDIIQSEFSGKKKT